MAYILHPCGISAPPGQRLAVDPPAAATICNRAGFIRPALTCVAGGRVSRVWESRDIRLPLPSRPGKGRSRGGKALRVAAVAAPAETVQEVAESEPESESKWAAGGERFEWRSQWYPVFIAEHLDKRVPHPATVLGRDMVVWWDPKGAAWQVFEDRCPHRLAPLSEGRVAETGHLQCSYHGWTFAPATGACSSIPQAPADGPPCHLSKRACAVVFPSTLHQRMIWVWPDSSQGAHQRATASPPPSHPELTDPDFFSDLAMAELPYSYETLIENFLDPCHVPFAHHKIQGNRNQARPYDLRVKEISKTGFVGEATNRGPVAFEAPLLATLRFTLPPQPERARSEWVKRILPLPRDEMKPAKVRRVTLFFFCVPVAPGKSKLFWAFPRNFAKIVYQLTPRWIAHQTNMLVLVSDLGLLRSMEHKFERLGGNERWFKLCYVPTTADACVIAFRKWFHKFSGSAVDFSGHARAASPEANPPSRRQLLDRYALHVEKCPHCRAALGFFQAAQTALQFVAYALVAFLAASALSPGLVVGRSFGVVLAGIALASFVLSKALASYTQQAFHFKDYIHALVK